MPRRVTRKVVGIVSALAVAAAGVGTIAATSANAASPVCGSGYKLVHTVSLGAGAPGRIEIYWNRSSKKNCALTVHTGSSVGKASQTSITLTSAEGRTDSDSGIFKYYAGPVYVYAPGCISVTGKLAYESKTYTGTKAGFSCDGESGSGGSTPTTKVTPITTAPSTSSGSGSDGTSPATGATTAGSDLSDVAKKLRAAQITSSFENSTTTIQYAYAENIGDGRGITAGRAGFTSGTDDLLELVRTFTKTVPNNPLAKYVPALEKVNGTGSTAGLDGFTTAFVDLAKSDARFRKAQDDLVDKLYFNPAMAMAKSYGVKTALGQAIIWDTYIQHGEGGTDGTAAILKATKSAMGGNVSGNEPAWISKFLDIRLQHLLNWSTQHGMSQDDGSSQSRVDALRSLVKAGKWDLVPTLSWKAYGDSFSITK